MCIIVTLSVRRTYVKYHQMYNLKFTCFVTRFKENKFVIYNLIEPQFCAKPSFSGQYIDIKLEANLGLP